MPLLLEAFYRAKPFIPRRAQIAARRVRARRIWKGVDEDPCQQIPRGSLQYPWPHDAQACLLITHDVESAAGQQNIPALIDIENQFGLKSCWNFVVRRYDVDARLIAGLRESGHEVGLHGVYHDGRKFESAATFSKRLHIMEQTAEAWGAVGFRSPSLNYDGDLLRRVRFEWDSSMPAWDPFQPRPGDCHKYVPFPLNDKCVELPVTLWQDFTVFDELGMNTIDIWRAQADAIYSAGGLVNVIVHPDYMVTRERLDLYGALLEYLTNKQRLWITTPVQVAAWARRRAAPAA